MNSFPWRNSGFARLIRPAIYGRIGNELVYVTAYQGNMGLQT